MVTENYVFAAPYGHGKLKVKKNVTFLCLFIMDEK
jgi:hypothetical protein